MGGGKGNDTIFNDATNVTILGGAGKDSIYTYNNHNVIDGGADNDTIIADNTRYNSISGGAGNDRISLSGGKNNTVIGGTGNDTITSGKNKTVFVYASGDGNDIINGYKSADTLNITSGSYTKSTVGNNVLIKVGSGTVTLVGAKGKSINIKKGSISNNLASSRDLFADDNYSTSQLDLIMQSQSLGEIDYMPTKQDSLQSVLAYAKK